MDYPALMKMAKQDALDDVLSMYAAPTKCAERELQDLTLRNYYSMTRP